VITAKSAHGVACTSLRRLQGMIFCFFPFSLSVHPPVPWTVAEWLWTRGWSQTNIVELWSVSRPRFGRDGHRDMWDLTTTDVFKMQWVFSVLPRQTNKYPWVLHTRVYFFEAHTMKGLLFPNQKRLGPFPKKAHTPSENGTGPSASSHMDTSQSCRKLNLPDSEPTHRGSALPSRVFLS